MAKTDWTLLDTVQPENMNQIGQEINQLRDDVDNIEVPPASTTKAGIVQLSNATNSSAENMAATPKAVKTAYDLAQSSLTAGNERKAELVAALVAKGVTATTSETWAQLLAKVTALIKATGTATTGQVLSGATFSNASANGLTGTMANNGAGGTVTPGATAQTKPAGYYSSPITVSAVTFAPANVLVGTTIAGTGGTMPNRSWENNHMPGSEATVWAGDRFFIRPPAGYYNGSTWVTAPVPGLVAPNVRSGVNIAGLVGTYKPISQNSSDFASSTKFFIDFKTGLNFPSVVQDVPSGTTAVRQFIAQNTLVNTTLSFRITRRKGEYPSQIYQASCTLYVRNVTRNIIFRTHNTSIIFSLDQATVNVVITGINFYAGDLYEIVISGLTDPSTTTHGVVNNLVVTQMSCNDLYVDDDLFKIV